MPVNISHSWMQIDPPILHIPHPSNALLFLLLYMHDKSNIVELHAHTHTHTEVPPPSAHNNQQSCQFIHERGMSHTHTKPAVCCGNKCRIILQWSKQHRNEIHTLWVCVCAFPNQHPVSTWQHGIRKLCMMTKKKKKRKYVCHFPKVLQRCTCSWNLV